MNNKNNLLKAKKALLVAAMTGMTTLTACASEADVKGAKRIEANALFNDRIYLNEDGNVVIEVKPEQYFTSNGIEYKVPYGYILTYDEKGKPIGRKVIKKKNDNKTNEINNVKYAYIYKEIEEGLYSNPNIVIYTEDSSLDDAISKYCGDDDCKVIIEIKAEKHKNNNETYYTVPSGFELTHNQFGEPIGRKTIYKKKTR
jgi:hypothetical protein